MPLSTAHGTKAVAKSVVYMFVLSKREKEGDLRVLVFNWLQRGAVHWHLLLISGDNKSGLLHDWHSFIELSFCLPFLFFSFSFLIGRPEVGRWNISEPISLTLGGWTTWIPKDYGWEKKMGRTGKKLLENVQNGLMMGPGKLEAYIMDTCESRVPGGGRKKRE